MENENNKKLENKFWIKENIIITVLLWSAFPWAMLVREIKNRTSSWLYAAISGIVSLFLVANIYGVANDSSKDTRIDYLETQIKKIETENLQLKTKIYDENDLLANDDIEKNTDIEETTPEVTPTKDIEVKEFGSGNYTCGIDFEPGKYNIVATEGSSGNVTTSNIFSGGVNAIMGLDSSWAEKEIKNIEFKDKMTLEIRGITINLVPVK